MYFERQYNIVNSSTYFDNSSVFFLFIRSPKVTCIMYYSFIRRRCVFSLFRGKQAVAYFGNPISKPLVNSSTGDANIICFLILKHSAFPDIAASVSFGRNLWNLCLRITFWEFRFLNSSGGYCNFQYWCGLFPWPFHWNSLERQHLDYLIFFSWIYMC